jgi:mannitol-1-phosphate 5-dehydrogenase
MKVKKQKFFINRKRIVIFGAGKIGRSFIGQLFSRSGYEVVFVDVDRQIVDALNERRQYKVVIKEQLTEEIVVENVRAIHALQSNEVVNEISAAGILAVCVGKNALGKIVPIIAKGIEKRFSDNPKALPLDIVLAENMRSAAAFVRHELRTHLASGFPISEKVGLVETSIGKMVPIMTEAVAKADSLLVFAEAYNQLILDRKGFVGDIPEVHGLAPKSNIKAWVDRKAFIHNLGHATAAYYGFYLHPECRYMHEVLVDVQVFQFTKSVMRQAADVLAIVYPDDLDSQELEDHIDDLLHRFRNIALGDTVFRVGNDLRRKLGAHDRFVGVIKLCKDAGLPYDKILKAFAYGFYFQARDESGNIYKDDALFLDEWHDHPIEVLTGICGLSDNSDRAKVLKMAHQDG